MLVISSDFHVCCQIIKEKLENFEKSTKVEPEMENKLRHCISLHIDIAKIAYVSKNIFYCWYN